MNRRTDTSFQVFAALLLLVTVGAHADPAVPRFGKAEMIKPVAVATAPHDGRAHGRLAFALSDEGFNEDTGLAQRAVRLYPIGNEERTREGSATASAPAPHVEKDARQTSQQAKRAAIPEPGSWAMILAGLLGLGAIARRRMPA